MSQKRALFFTLESSRNDQEGNPESLEGRLTAEYVRSSYRSLRRVTCRLNDGILTLRGQVSSYYHKQLAQEMVRRQLNGAVAIRNDVEVIPADTVQQ